MTPETQAQVLEQMQSLLETFTTPEHTFKRTTPVGDPTAADLVRDLEAQLTSCESLMDVHKSEMRFVTDIIALAHKVKAEMLETRYRNENSRNLLEADLREAKLAQSREQFAKGLAPDMENPELLKLISILESWEHYAMLDSYQVEDITFTCDRFLRTRDQKPDVTNVFTRGVINANDTGMGKTVETIAFLWVMRQINPDAKVVWFTKIPLVKETAPEAVNKWGFNIFPVLGNATEKVSLINTMKTMPWPLTLIMNYETVNNASVMEAIGDDIDFMVIDEVHKLRGGSNQRPTQIWQNTLAFKQRTNAWPLMLSGSIINNKPKELWSFLHIMDENRFPSMHEFNDMCQSGILSDNEILKILAPSMFRRIKSDVDIKMPTKEWRHHRIPLSDRVRADAYNGFAEQMNAWLVNQNGQDVNISIGNMLERMIRLRICLAYPETMTVKQTIVDPLTMESVKVPQTVNLGKPEKLDYAIELANELIMDGEQVIIATANFNAPLDYIASRLIGSCEKLYGDNTAIAGDIAARFRAGETRVILTNMVAGGEGFNLQKSKGQKEWPGGADNMIIVDDWYNPEKVRQLTDRIWRRGSDENGRVIIHLLQYEDSIDEVIEAVRNGKLGVNGQIMEHSALKAGEWKELLKKALSRK